MKTHSLPGPDNVASLNLPNGIEVLARENHTSPAVVVQGFIVAGSVNEPAGRAGLASFTAELLLRGTAHRSFDQINEAVEGVGADIRVSGGLHTTGFRLKCLAEDFRSILDVLADALLHPTFPVEQAQKVQGEILTQLRERDNDTRQVASLAFRGLAYPAAHPYSRSTRGERETVERLTRDHLEDFYRTHYEPQGMVIAVVGAIEQDEAHEAVADVFGQWTRSERGARTTLPSVSPITQVRRDFRELAGKTQADIIVGHPGLARNSPHYMAAALANMVLGGFGLMGRLGTTVRDEQGLAYYAYSRLEAGLGPGPWTAVAGVNPRNLDRAIESILAEIRRLGETEVSPKELEDAKAYMTGSLPLRLETNEGVAQALLDIELHQLGLDYLQRYASLVNAVSAQDVQSVAAQYLHADSYALAIAGPANDAG